MVLGQQAGCSCWRLREARGGGMWCGVRAGCRVGCITHMCAVLCTSTEFEFDCGSVLSLVRTMLVGAVLYVCSSMCGLGSGCALRNLRTSRRL
jgi:hypothetical protein